MLQILIRLRCKGCGQEYRLGDNALVVTVEGQVSEERSRLFQGGVLTVRARDASKNSRDCPDLVDVLKRDWMSLEPHVIREQREEIERIESSMYWWRLRKRWWRCRQCNTIQTYKEASRTK